MTARKPHGSFSEEKHQLTCSFRQGEWATSDWLFVKRRDMAGRCEWIQKVDCIENDGNHTSMVYARKFSGDVTVSATTAFADRMAPAIVLVNQLIHENGTRIFNEHVEITLWDEGVNIWRHHTDNNKSLWELTAFSKFKLNKNIPYQLEVTKKGKTLSINVDGHVFGYVENSLQGVFHVGIVGGEGVNRFYDVAVRSAVLRQDR